MMFIASGLGLIGQSACHAAPETLPYAVNRYLFEAKRHYQYWKIT